MKNFLITITILLLAVAHTSVAFADTNCLQVYGGGLTDKQICPSPTPKLVPLPRTNTTTGAQTVYPTGKSQSTPNTGPESLSYIILLGMLVGGIYLRTKTKHSI